MALKHIALRDFVIVRELALDLASGFSVLTGETGAGKSILIDALQLVLGSRADVGTIREGAPRTEVSAEFDCPVALRGWLGDAGFDPADTLLLRRTVDAQGKSRAWINGSAATAAQLRELGEQMVDIHGQHAWQSLTRPDAVRGLLDAYASVDTVTLGQLWSTWRIAQKTLDEARRGQDSIQRERDRLAWQIGEVDKLSPGAGEWEELNASHTRLAHAQALLDAAAGVLTTIEDEPHNVLAALSRSRALLMGQAQHEPEFSALADILASSSAQLEDVVHSLRTYQRRIDLDPERLTALDERMGQWMSLSRRYKRQPVELPALLESWKQELAQLDATDLATLEHADKIAKDAFLSEARRIGVARSRAAPLLSKAVTQAMQGLGMKGGRFEVSITKLEQPCASGLEDISFLVAGHAGSSPRPVGKVASGGELSRVALAIAVTTSQLGAAQTLIFDEVDAGVGGAVAETVGRLMKQLGRDRQVLAVTHLPQVAACADQHLVVSKQSDQSGTVSRVEPVQGEDRVAEVARMLGGERLSGTTLAHAKEMLGALK